MAPHNEIASLNFSNELVKTREYTRALSICQRDLEDHPNSSKAMGAAGQAAFLLGKFDLAERYYAEASLLDPSRPVLAYYLGLTRMKLHKYREAVSPLQTALSADPNLLGIHFSLGNALAQLGDWNAALPEYEAELRANPDSPEARRAIDEARGHLRMHQEGQSR
jgi:tetratricopeptide (TPR) repeat protein